MRKGVSVLMIRIIKIISNIMRFVGEGLLAFGLISLFILVFLMVITRNFFGWYWEGTQEVSQMIVVCVTFFGAVLAASDGKHINMCALRELSSKRVKPFFLLIINIISALACLILAIASFNFTYASFSLGHRTTALQVPKWFFWYTPLPVALFLMTIIFGIKVFQILSSFKEEKE